MHPLHRGRPKRTTKFRPYCEQSLKAIHQSRHLDQDGRWLGMLENWSDMSISILPLELRPRSAYVDGESPHDCVVSRLKLHFNCIRGDFCARSNFLYSLVAVAFSSFLLTVTNNDAVVCPAIKATTPDLKDDQRNFTMYLLSSTMQKSGPYEHIFINKTETKSLLIITNLYTRFIQQPQ